MIFIFKIIYEKVIYYFYELKKLNRTIELFLNKYFFLPLAFTQKKLNFNQIQFIFKFTF